MKRLALVCLVLGLGAVSRADIPLVGMDGEGHEVVTYLSRDKYAEGMAALLTAAHDEAIPPLKRLSNGKRWSIRTVVVGVGADIELGLAPFFTLGIVPRFRAIISNSVEPIIP